MNKIWELIQNDEFEEACIVADVEYKMHSNIFLLRNKLYALMHLRRFHQVIKLAGELIILENAASSFDFKISAIAHWLINERTQAIDLLLKAEKCLYQDAAGGIEVKVYEYFAAVKMGDDKLKRSVTNGIKKTLKNKHSPWPGPLGNFIIERYSQEEVLSFVSSTPILKERHLCQANFVFAIKELESGNQTAYLQRLRDSIAGGSFAYLEGMYYLSKGEIEEYENSSK